MDHGLHGASRDAMVLADSFESSGESAWTPVRKMVIVGTRPNALVEQMLVPIYRCLLRRDCGPSGTAGSRAKVATFTRTQPCLSNRAFPGLPAFHRKLPANRRSAKPVHAA